MRRAISKPGTPPLNFVAAFEPSSQLSDFEYPYALVQVQPYGNGLYNGVGRLFIDFCEESGPVYWKRAFPSDKRAHTGTLASGRWMDSPPPRTTVPHGQTRCQRIGRVRTFGRHTL